MQLCFRNRKGLGRDSDLFFALHQQKISHEGGFWTEETGDWSAVCCEREAVSSSCQENCAIPHLLLPSEYSGESRKVWCRWSLGFSYCSETGSMGAGREPTCEGGSNALQNRLEIQTHIQKQTIWRGKTILFSTPWTITLSLAPQLLRAYDEGITQGCENSKATRGYASLYPCKQFL